MQAGKMRPQSRLGVTRTGTRAARIGAFAFEVWSRGWVGGLVEARALSARERRLESEAMAPEERARELSWVAENMCALHGVRPTVSGQVPTQPSLLVANHMSYFDPLVITSLVPLTAVAKREVADWPIIGPQARRMGVLYYERQNVLSGATVLRQAMRAFERGVSVLVFPEGTTTTGEHVLPFKRGSFGAALRAGVPIVPIAISYDSPKVAWVGDTTFVSHYVRSVTKPYTAVDVQFLPPLACGRGESPEQLAEQARGAIQGALHQRQRASHVSRFADVASSVRSHAAGPRAATA